MNVVRSLIKYTRLLNSIPYEPTFFVRVLKIRERYSLVLCSEDAPRVVYSVLFTFDDISSMRNTLIKLLADNNIELTKTYMYTDDYKHRY